MGIKPHRELNEKDTCQETAAGPITPTGAHMANGWACFLVFDSAEKSAEATPLVADASHVLAYGKMPMRDFRTT